MNKFEIVREEESRKHLYKTFLDYFFKEVSPKYEAQYYWFIQTTIRDLQLLLTKFKQRPEPLTMEQQCEHKFSFWKNEMVKLVETFFKSHAQFALQDEDFEEMLVFLMTDYFSGLNTFGDLLWARALYKARGNDEIAQRIRKTLLPANNIIWNG